MFKLPTVCSSSQRQQLARGRKEERLKKKEGGEGIQAPNRAEIILDHKGWNSIENLGYSKNCQSIVEKGKRRDEQDVGAEGQVQVLILDDGGEGRQVQLVLLDDGSVHLTA